MRWLFALCVGCGSAAGGGGGGGGDDEPPMPDSGGSGSGSAASVFDPAITNVVVEIDYEQGQEPYTGPILGFGDTFEPTLTNIDRVFAGKKSLTIPAQLSQMENVGPITDEQLTVADILAIAAQHRQAKNDATTKTYYVVFVTGSFADDSGTHAFVLGVSIGDTIAMFKDVIRSTNIVVAPNVVRYVEQSTLIHELAHSIGLVDNGVALTAQHKDAAHGAHCNNNDCVMYWQNEGSSDAAQFVQRRLLTGSTILFDDACLADVDALSGGL